MKKQITKDHPLYEKVMRAQGQIGDRVKDIKRMEKERKKRERNAQKSRGKKPI